ncbi:GNAT family N-acetyltransferase [Roseobacter weihaiensis]|uniref:GNAT family N-acetyltransferase n=1 Tax=Roseobacter weihaiensis TaxID=2763262 RepID=UPI001D0B16D6|nr:GNAT family N-acetyltransferase [Roseobacter sp. H9]
MTPTAAALYAAVDATWPAARMTHAGPWLLRDGQGGGKRVSAATAEQEVSDADIVRAEQEMQAMGQPALFMVRAGEAPLDTALAARGYEIIDPVEMLTCPVTRLTDIPVPPLTTFVIWEPLAIMADIWAKGGIGPARLEVMKRAKIKTAVLARWNQKPAGVAFVALEGPIAMVHAVEVLPAHRRQGVAQWIMRQAAFWARDHGAETMAVLCTTANTAALQLYSGLGFHPAAQYHYRQIPASGDPRDG